MEQRLALSATPVNGGLSFQDLDFSGVYLQTADKIAGGNIPLEFALDGVNRGTSLSTSDAGFLDIGFVETGFVETGFVDIWDGEIVFHGPVFSQPDFERPPESDGVGSLVTPIPQPQLGDGEIGAGLVAVAEIFHPTKPLPASQVDHQIAQSEPVSTTFASTADDSWKSVSLSRGRDMYFEVAALSDEHETSDTKNSIELSSKIAPLMYQQTLLRYEAERASSTTSQEQTKTPQQMPALAPSPQQEVRPADSEHSETPANDAAVGKAQRTAQDGEVPSQDEFSRSTDARDRVFDTLTEGGELSEEGIALRTENQQSQSATWPVLAALAATGWMVRSRRSTGKLPSHRQPLRK
jgi:hypothetical protein